MVNVPKPKRLPKKNTERTVSMYDHYQYMTYDPKRGEEAFWESGQGDGILQRPRKIETVDGFRDRSPMRMDFSEQLGKIKRGIWKKKGVEYIRITDRLDAEGMRKIHGYHSVEKVWRKASDEGDEVEKRLREYRDEIIRVDWEENQSEQVQVNVDTKGEEMQIEEVKKDVIKKKEITKDAITTKN